MSVKVSTWVWHESAAAGTDLLILLALADQANDAGTCWPSIPYIARKVRMSERTVYRALDALEESGVIDRKPRSGQPTLYRVNCKPNPRQSVTPQPQDDTCQPVTPDDSSPLTLVSPTPDTVGRGPLTPVSPKPSRTVKNRQGARKRAAKSNDTPEHRATDRAYQRLGKAFNFMAVRGMAKWMIHDRGLTEQQVEDAFVGIYEAGKPLTKQVIGQWLDGHIGNANRSASREERRNRGEWWA